MSPDIAQTDHIPSPASRRLAKLLIPVGLAMVLFGLLVWPGLAYNFGNKFRLSTTLPNKAFNPDIAAAGNYVAAVWSEGYNSDSGTKEYGRVYLKSAHATNGWEGRIQVFPATGSVWGRDPRLVFDPDDSATVHVVWAQASGCPSCSWDSIYYTTCALTDTDSCATPSQVNVSGLTNASTPDVAVDDSDGSVHVVWHDGSSSPGNVKYCKKGSCTTPSTVSSSGQHPSLVFANNSLHLVWDTGSANDSNIKYERDGTLGNNAWDVSSWQTWWSGTHSTYQEPSFPTIGANGTAVYVVWAVQGKSDATTYALAFDFSSNTGASWQDPSGFGLSIPENEDATVFTTTWVAESSSANALYSLQPDVVVTGTGTSAYAHLVWHGKEDSESSIYEAWYSYLAGYSGSQTWLTSVEVVTGTHQDIGLPAIAVGTALSETHVAMVEDANASSFSDIEVYYVGANGNRDNDDDASEGGTFLPIVMKNYTP